MPSWLLPAVKLILPHVSDIVAAAKPVFTRRKTATEEADPGNVTQQQITELQAAASANATHVKELAEQLRLTVTAIEQAAAAAEKRMKRVYMLGWTAALVSLAALALSIYALFA